MGRKILLIILYLYAFIFSILKTIRKPNEWAEVHWLMDYRFGFIKRGLAGEIFGWFFHKDEFNILLVSAGILFLLYFLIFRIAIKEIFEENSSFYRILFLLIFFLSGYITFSAHLIGYFDHVIFLLTILVIFLNKKKKIFLSSFIVAFSIFIHEISFFLMLPVSCFALIIAENTNDFSFKNIFTFRLLKKLVLFLILPVFAIIAVLLCQELNDKNYFSLIFNYLKQYPFINDERANSLSSAYTTSFSYYFNDESPHFLQRLFVSKGTILFGIPIVFSLWMMFKEFELRKNIQLLFLIAIVGFIPLLLHAIAWDTYRIWSFPFMILFLIFWILSSKFKAESNSQRNLSTLEMLFFFLSFLLVALVPNILFDNEVERFSLITRIIIIIPVFFILFFIKKAPIEKN